MSHPHGTIDGWTPELGMTVKVTQAQIGQSEDVVGFVGTLARIDWNGTLLVTDESGKSVLSDWFRVTVNV